MSTSTSRPDRGRPGRSRPAGDGTRASQAPRSAPSGPAPAWRRPVVAAVAIVVVLGALFGIYQAASDNTTDAGTTPQTAYDVGSPGPGEAAPEFTLPTADGGQTDLTDYRGQSVLLYFQEGLMCQPCWDQITDLEKASADVEAAGVDAVLSITSDPAQLLAQKVADEGITTPVAADADLAVSRQYATNQYGMMGDSRNGHSFILVGPDGTIQWRGDYGGVPDYTMYLPVDQILADLRAGTDGS